MREPASIIDSILRAIAVGMSVASLVLGGLGTVDERTMIFFLSVGLMSLAVASLSPRR